MKTGSSLLIDTVIRLLTLTSPQHNGAYSHSTWQFCHSYFFPSVNLVVRTSTMARVLCGECISSFYLAGNRVMVGIFFEFLHGVYLARSFD